MSLRSQSSGGEPPRKKKKKKASMILPHTTISSLSDDLVLSCLARVSRLYYPILSLVSKKFRSLIASPELYTVRSFSGRTESCIYVCLGFSPDSDPRWFTLCGRPNTRKRKKKSSGNLLFPIPSHHSTQALNSSVVAIGSSIYFIGGYINRFPCSNVSVLDCRSHTWHQAPNMQVARVRLEANVIDEKIYVVGGRATKDYNSSNWIEFFDPKTQIWNYVSSSLGPGKVCGRENVHSTEIDGKICMYDGGLTVGPGEDLYEGVAYNPKDGTCEPIGWVMCKAWFLFSHCVIDNMLFYYYNKDKGFKWFDTKARLWRNLKGLGKMMRRIAKDSRVKLANYGGKMVVLWDRYVPSSRCPEVKVIWCGVIAVERRNSDEIWGTVEWFDVVLTVPTSCHILRVLATTL